MFLSSSIVKELGRYELQNGELDRFLPPEIIPDFLARMAEQKLRRKHYGKRKRS